ncbi:hypothetical protein FB472_2748 [Rhodoglobus vestalii]|uniref:Uncharacterized protein n=1 Tax=Rhodoglobus vestalii TaxID=193384 RepID=A0A8H2K9F9_9MICO|nr:hypothetical protein [Rhodoglobus vestalii]TQO21079.1 hypothetical protein FB472_2748 [Rhodoglobus vestalii]
MTESELELYIAKLVADAPPLSEEQIGILTTIFATQPPLRAAA